MEQKEENCHVLKINDPILTDTDLLKGRNILIDHSFQAAVDHEYHQFSFAAGGAGIE